MAFRDTSLRTMQSALPVLGFAVLFSSLLGYAHILYPLKLWQGSEMLKVLADLIAGMWGVLFGLVFILLPLSPSLSVQEVRWRARMSWLTLFFALFYLVLIILLYRHTVRVAGWLMSQEVAALATVDSRRDESMQNLEKLEGREVFEANLQRLGIAAEELKKLDAVGMKIELRRLASEIYERAKVDIKKSREDRVRDLYKDSLRSGLNGCLAVLLLLALWWNGRSYRRSLVHAVARSGSGGDSEGDAGSGSDGPDADADSGEAAARA